MVNGYLRLVYLLFTAPAIALIYLSTNAREKNKKTFDSRELFCEIYIYLYLPVIIETTGMLFEVTVFLQKLLGQNVKIRG